MLTAIEIFCCYAREDQPLLQQFKNHLMSLQWQGLIQIWSDTNINAGEEWEKAIEQHLETAEIILLLISPDFMASEYCYSKEMHRAMQRHEQQDARVIPIVLRPTYWRGAPFAKLQFLPTNAKPITDQSWSRDEALYDIVEQIDIIVRALRIKNGYSKLRPDDPTIIQNLRDLVDLYTLLNKLEEIERLYEEAFQQRCSRLGINHSSTEQCLRDMITLYEKQGRREKITLLYQRTFQLRARKLRGDDRRSLERFEQNLHILSNIYDNENKIREKSDLYTKSFRICSKTLGINDPLSRYCYNELMKISKVQD